MNILALLEKDISISESVTVSIIAIVLVFVVLALLIGIASLFQKGMDAVDSKLMVKPVREENKILDEDNDAEVAVIAATIDFYNEFKKNPEVISVKRVEE